MNYKKFQEWLSEIDDLSPAQRDQVETVFLGGSQESSSLAAIECSATNKVRL